MNHEKLPYKPKPEDIRKSPAELARLREKLARDVEEFLAAGGEIQRAGIQRGKYVDVNKSRFGISQHFDKGAA